VSAREARAEVAAPATHILFFDGVCGLCNRAVHFVLTHDRRVRFRYATLQGAFAARELPPRGGNPADLDTMYVLTAGGQLLQQSRAVFFVLRELGGPWRALSWLRVLPRALSDRAYRVVARSRYRPFGRLDACPIHGPAERGRFITD
jgi:predicted DCC family thiol-disulfide oxidoreductase YuxK